MSTLGLAHIAVALCFFSATYLSVRYAVRGRSVDRSASPCPQSERIKISPTGYTKTQVLEARKPTNVRLVNLFDFATSTFVSDDLAVHTAFTRAADSLLKRSRRDWGSFLEVSRRAAAQFAPRGGQLVAFHQYIQAVVLATLLCGLFSSPQHPVNLVDLTFEDLVRVTSGITTLWENSKRSQTPMPAELSAVNSLLQQWLVRLPPVSRSSAAWAIAADDNPLEFIVPAFETLWRVVAVAFVEAHGNAAWCAPFLSLASRTDVPPAAFCEGTPSVDDFIHETLRLRPPTRRIERIWEGKSVKADVERAQRNPSIWGANAEEFDPLRTRSGELLAFGARPLKCPGATWAPQAAGILVAALLSEGLLLQRGEKLGGRDGWDDWWVTH